MTRVRLRPGFALMEVIIVSLLLGLTFFACTTVYVAVLKNFLSVRGTVSRNDVVLAVEAMARKIATANEITVAADQINLRLDQPAYSNVAYDTPSYTAGDSMVKYKIMSNKLYWRWDDAGTAGYSQDPTTASEEVVPGLTLLTGSQFTLVNTTGTGSATTIKIRLVSQYGDANQNIPVKTMTCETSVTPVSKPKN